MGRLELQGNEVTDVHRRNVAVPFIELLGKDLIHALRWVIWVPEEELGPVGAVLGEEAARNDPSL